MRSYHISIRALTALPPASSHAVSRTDSHERSGSSSSPTGLSKECQNQERGLSISSAKYIKRKSSLAKTDPSRSIVGKWTNRLNKI